MNIICLLFDKRIPDTTIDLELKEHGLDVQFFLAGDGHTSSRPYDFIDKVYPGKSQAKNYGDCLQSIIRIAQFNKWPSLLFLEDDATLNPRYKQYFGGVFNEVLSQYEKVKKEKDRDWNMLYLGGNVQGATSLEQLSENLFEANYLLDMQAVIFNESSYQTILDIEVTDKATIDGVIAAKMSRGELTALTVLPVLITQKDNWSFNEKKFVSRSKNHLL